MLLRMTTGLSGPTLSLGPGDEHEFPQDEAMRLIAAGYAVRVSARPIEAAVNAPVPEVRITVLPKKKKRRR